MRSIKPWKLQKMMTKQQQSKVKKVIKVKQENIYLKKPKHYHLQSIIYGFMKLK
jgi:hypothetical protein